MKYITGLQALNLTCSLDTTGDWHQPCLDWSHLSLWDTDTAFYKDYGIEENSHVPEHPGEIFKVANHIRALLDMLYAKDFGNAGGDEPRLYWPASLRRRNLRQGRGNEAVALLG